MATDQTTRLEAATVKAENGSQIVYDFANGPAKATVQTASGPIPTLAGKLDEISDTLAISAGIYPTTAAGLAATSNGQVFLVYASDDDDIIYRVYQNQNGTAVDTGKSAISGTDLEQALAQADQAASTAQQAADSVSAASQAIALISGPDGQANVRYLPPFTGSLGRSGKSKLSDVVSAKDFGAIGDGQSHPLSSVYASLAQAQSVYPHAVALTDEIDWCALQAAASSDAEVIHVTPGVYLSNRKVLAKNRDKSFFGYGESSTEIRFTAQVDYGVRFEQNAAFCANLAGIFVSTNLLNNGTAVSISYVGFQGEYERNKRLVGVHKNRAAGTDYFSFGWKNCFEFDEVTLPNVFENFAVGYRKLGETGEAQWWPFTDSGFIYTSSTNLQPTDVLFFANDVRYARYAYRNRGVLEGVRYDSCLAVACKYGIFDDRREVSGDPTVDPWLSVHNCHLNVSAIGIRSYYCYEGFIDQNLIYQFVFVDEAFTGISTETGNNWKIMNNQVDGNKDSAFTTTAIKMQQNNKSMCQFNTMEFVDVGIEASGTNGMVSTRFFMNRATGRDGAEIQSVTYTNGIVSYQNPSSNPTGIVAEGSNAANVSIASGGIATVTTFDLGAFPAGSAFRVNANCQVLKGGTTGSTKLYVEKVSGDASVSYMANATQLGTQNPSHTANTYWVSSLSGIIKKTTKGSLVIKLAVSSGGSNAAVAPLDGQACIERIA